MIWSCVKPVASVSITSVLPGVWYLTKLRPRGRPPYWYPENLEMAVSALSTVSKRTTPVPRERPFGSY